MKKKEIDLEATSASPSNSEHCDECKANGQARCLVWTTDDKGEIEISLCSQFPEIDDDRRMIPDRR